MSGAEGLIAETTDTLRRELDEDLVGIWEIFWILRRARDGWADEEISAAAEEVLVRLLAGGAIIGDLDHDGDYAAWEDQDGAVARVVDEWRAMDRDPAPAEIAWLTR